MSTLRLSFRSIQRSSPLNTLSRRSFVTQPHGGVPSRTGSNTPWFIGSLLVFGPLLFNLTSPPASKKKVSIVPPVKQIQETIVPVSAPEKPRIQRPYVLIGAGTASFAAAEAIKEKDPDANVIIIGDEDLGPYMRPPLSKELWFTDDANATKNLRFKDWQGQERSVYYKDLSEYEVIQDASGSDQQTRKIKLLLNNSVKSIGVEDHTVTLADGSVIFYNKVLLATGGKPKMMEHGVDPSKVTTYRGIHDYEKLEQLAKEGKHIAVIGGGFLGSELAVALAHKAKKNDSKVSQIVAEDGNMASVFPAYLSKWTTERIQSLGVDVKIGNPILSVAQDPDGKAIIQLENNEQVHDIDHIVLAIGIEPRIELAKDAGLEIDEKRSGVVVNAELEARKDVFVAGDVVSFHDVQLGRRRIEHHDHAVLSGRHAGENMVGAAKPYKHQSMFWSDLGPEIGFEAVGVIDSQLSTVSVWAKDSPTEAAATSEEKGDISENSRKDSSVKFGKGLVFYTRENKIVGMLLFNVFGKVQEARNIIQSGYSPEKIDNLLKRFDLHEEQ